MYLVARPTLSALRACAIVRFTDEWLEYYNAVRPHDGAGQVPSRAFLPSKHQIREPCFYLST